MNRFGSFLFGIAVGAVGLYFVMHYSIVRAKDGFHFIPKVAAKLDNPYIDIRQFKLDDWKRQQPLAIAVLRAQKGYLISDQSLIGFKETTQQLMNQASPKAPPLSKPSAVAPSKSASGNVSDVFARR